MLNSEMMAFTETADIPGDAQVDIRQFVTRIEQRVNGRVTSGPRIVISSPGIVQPNCDGMVNTDRLEELHHKWRQYPKPPLKI